MKVAVVEDSLPVRRLLVRRAENEPGVTVVAQATSEDEAVEAVLATSPDVVLLDIHLAPGSGFSVLKRLRQRSFGGQVFVLSASDRATVAAQCERHGADGFYDKAFDFEQLMVDLRELARGGAANSRWMFHMDGARAVVNG
ncbi:Response regulator receiver domain-containing protein [Roseateles sp. YR242]|uniref:response regulator n=1 Tax=Roseateles sp. YR242 TaxID=1855305 RepID=UPI0008ABD8DF|nr:response regulator transcription factor [Roseateles sp. YR242]SEL83727.1 Response regulator receiver domain-containing protein [Roseateles sp. YR242]